MINNEKSLNFLSEEEIAEIESNVVDLALEKFFDNVLECVLIKEEDFCFRP